MTPMEFAETVSKLPAYKQNEFFERLKTELSEDDVQTMMKFVSLVRMFKSPARYEAMKNAVCDVLCEEFYGHEVERKKNIEDTCNPVYMMTIL